MNLLELFRNIDDFWQEFESILEETPINNGSKRQRASQMSWSLFVHWLQLKQNSR